MKTLVSVAVLGLVPIPPMADDDVNSGRDDLRVMSENRKFARLRLLPDPVIKTKVTRDELARIHQEIQAINADASP